MYDIAIIGEGLSGLLTALAASEQGWRTALVTKGVGRLVQSSGVRFVIARQYSRRIALRPSKGRNARGQNSG
ncbi:MAG: FAD-binding protein [Sporolactobacillus sp.]